MAKRNAHGSGSIRKRADGTWEARYTLGRDPGTGKPIRKSVYGKTQKEVREKLRAAAAAVDEGTYFEPAKLTLGQWLDTWLAEYTMDLKPRTRENYEMHVCRNIKPYLGAVPLAQLRAPMIQQLYNRLSRGEAQDPADRRKRRPALSPKTLQNLHGTLHKALQQAVELELLPHNPADACKRPRVQKPEIRPLDEGEMADFLDAIRGDPFEALYLVDLYTGLRLGEILGLCWDCVNFSAGTIHVRRQLQKSRKGGRYYFSTPKSGKGRVVAMPETVRRALKELQKEQRLRRLQAGGAWMPSGGVWADSGCQEVNRHSLVFTDAQGRHVADQTVYHHFKKLAATIGRPDARFHDPRHSYAVAAIRSGDDIKTVQGNLGHATAAFTLDVYGHVTDQMKQDSARRMELYLASLRKEKKGC
ncbi:MAG: tyrosine recombinase XerC [Candidatus Onthomonas sp.]